MKKVRWLLIFALLLGSCSVQTDTTTGTVSRATETEPIPEIPDDHYTAEFTEKAFANPGEGPGEWKYTCVYDFCPDCGCDWEWGWYKRPEGTFVKDEYGFPESQLDCSGVFTCFTAASASCFCNGCGAVLYCLEQSPSPHSGLGYVPPGCDWCHKTPDPLPAFQAPIPMPD